jgi:hypothetical protein
VPPSNVDVSVVDDDIDDSNGIDSSGGMAEDDENGNELSTTMTLSLLLFHTFRPDTIHSLHLRELATARSLSSFSRSSLITSLYRGA